MEYTVQRLAQIAGVSARTLRYYDEIGILKPARVNSSGYRIYGKDEVDRLQQILFYKELGVSLEEIKVIITDPNFDRKKALKEHQQKLLDRKKQLELLIVNVNKTIESMEGVTIMKDKEKFEGFKQKLIDDNEQKYGKEIREKYGSEVINTSNEKLKNMTQKEYEQINKLENEIMETLKEAFKTNDPSSELAQKVARLHREWISFYWDNYTKEAHAGVAQMYVYDERFKAYYDKEQEGMAEFLKESILIYTGMKE
jgi:DNA-binding transcriptional MerR regulator